MNEFHYAEIAYNAYCESRDWKSIRGERLPPFDMQSVELQKAWKAAADAVLKEINESNDRPGGEE